MRLSSVVRTRSRARAEQLAHALRSVSLFRDLPSADLVAVWQRLVEVRLPAGAVICRRGEPGDGFYLIQRGSFAVHLGVGPQGLFVRRLAAGDFFGELALLTSGPRTADVVATEDAVLWALDRRDFEELTTSSMPLLQSLARHLADRVVLMTLLLEERAAGISRPGAGLRVGPYVVLDQLGVGGMAAVFSARHATTGTAAALKVLPAGWSATEEFRARLVREAAVLQGLDHPNVIRVLDVGQVAPSQGGGCYLAMELVPGALDRLLRAQYPDSLPVTTALSVAQGVAAGLAAVHTAGLVHRDVKPSNILLRADGTPVLTDFGLVHLAAAAAQAQRLTASNVIVGTADYLSPEQALGAPLDGRSDLYSLGVVLYELLTGHVPFAGHAPLETLRLHVEAQPPLPDELSPPVRAIVERALQKRPEERVASAAETGAALGQALEGLDPG